MADFAPAVARLIEQDEGGYVNDPHDTGGATRFGISTAFLARIHSPLTMDKVTVQVAEDLYRRYFWEEYRYGEIIDQDIANELLSMAVVAGPSVAHQCIQRALLAVHHDAEFIGVDGILGVASRAAVNAAPNHCLSAAFRSEQAGHFRDLDNARFEKGWLRRAYR
jgi:lysozyme family protein